MSREKATGFPQLIPEGGFTGSSTSAKFSLGQLAMDTEGNLYRYVKFVDNAVTDGDVVYPASTSEWDVSSDYTGGTSKAAKVCGVAVGSVSANSYGWIQISGIHDAVHTDGGVVAGDPLIGHSTDGQADTMAAGEEHLVFGYALEDDSTATPYTAAAYIFCL